MKLSTLAKSTLLASALLISSTSLAADIDMNADKNDLAISGYDTVSYFTQGKAVPGSSKFTATYKNAIYQFASAANRDLFRKNPNQYAPQFGGFCAMGVALEKKFDVDPQAFKIVDNKLYLNLNPAVQKKWLTDVPGYIQTAENNWGEIKTKTPEKLNAN
ncbi:MAG: YHS domain-containing (seleno)protein [Pseudomonadota bacterium]